MRWATSPLPSWGPKRGRKCYITSAFSGIPNKGEQNQKWLPHPCLLEGPKEGGNATSALHCRGSPMPSMGSKIRSGYFTLAFLGAQKRVEMLRHPCILGDPQRQAWGTKSEVVASPLPCRGSKGGRKCYVTLAFLGFPNAKRREQNQKWLPHPCLLGSPKEGGNATSPLQSWGSPTPSAGSKVESGYLTPAFLGAQKRAEMLCHPCNLGVPQRQAWEAKSEVATSPLPSWGPKRGRKWYVTLAFSGVPNAKRREQNQKWLPHPCLLEGPKEGGNATPPLQAWVSPTPSVGSKIRGGCLTTAFLGAQKRAEMVRHPCILGDPNAKRREQSRKWLPHPCLLGGPKEGGNATSPLHSWGSPTPSVGSKIRSGYLTPAFLGAQKRAEMVRHPCILRGPQREEQGAKSEVATSPLPSWGPKRGRKRYATPASLGFPNAKRGEQNQKWLPHPCLLGGPKEGGNATSPLHSRGSPTPSAGSEIRSGCLTLAFLRARKRAKMVRHPCILGGPQRQARGAKSKVATSPLPSWGPKRGRKCYVTPALLGIANAKHGEQNQKWLLHPCLLGGPKEGGNATSPLHSWGSPTKGNKIRSGCLTPAFLRAQKRAEMLRQPYIVGDPQCQAWGAKSEVATSPLPSWGPKRGRKCYVTPAFLGIPNAKRGEQNQKWLPHPCLVGVPKEGGNATSPLHSWGSPTPSAGSKIRSGYLTLAFLGAQKRAEMRRHPCNLGVPQRQAQGAKSKVATSPLPSWGPKRGRKCYATPAISGFPNAKRGKQNQKWLPHPCLLGGPKEGGNGTSPLHSPGSPTRSAGSKIRSGCLIPAFLRAQKRAEMLRHPCKPGFPQHQAWGAKSEVAASPLPSWGPKRGRKWYVTPAFSGIPTPSAGSKVESGYLTPAFLGAQKRAEMLRHPCILGVPQRQVWGAKSEVATSPLPSWGPKRGRKWYVTLAFSGVPNAKSREQNQKWLPHPCLLGGPKEGENGTPRLQAWVSPTPSVGSKIRSGYLTLAFLGAQKRAEMLRHPCILGDPQRQARGAKSEVAASPLPF